MCKCEESNNQINRESDDVIEHVRTKFTSRLWFSFPYHESQLFWETYKKIYVSWDKIVEVLFLAIDLWSRIWLFCLLINFHNFASKYTNFDILLRRVDFYITRKKFQRIRPEHTFLSDFPIENKKCDISRAERVLLGS